MELVIQNQNAFNQLELIKWNNEELKKELKEKLEKYNNIVYTEKEINDAKKDKANLNKLLRCLEDERKRIKKIYLSPYEHFEKQMKEVTSLVNEPISLIGNQLKEFEETRQNEKIEEIKKFYDDLDGYPFKPMLEMIFQKTWLNKTTSLDKIKQEICDDLETIKHDLETLKIMPKFAFESIEVYKTTLNMNMAINEGKKIADIQKKKEEARKEEIKSNNSNDNNKQWIGFKAYLSKDDCILLKEFFFNNNIQYKAI